MMNRASSALRPASTSVAVAPPGARHATLKASTHRTLPSPRLLSLPPLSSPVGLRSESLNLSSPTTKTQPLRIFHGRRHPRRHFSVASPPFHLHATISPLLSPLSPPPPPPPPPAKAPRLFPHLTDILFSPGRSRDAHQSHWKYREDYEGNEDGCRGKAAAGAGQE